MKLRPEAMGLATPSVRTRVEASRMALLCDVLNDRNPIFTEGWQGGPPVAPPTFINCFREEKSRLLIEELGVNMPRLLHGEQVMHYHAPIRPDDHVYQRVAIVDVRERETKAMGRADFFRVWITLHDERGNLLHEAYQSFFVRQEDR